MGPQHGRGADGGFAGNSDLVAADALVQSPQELLRQVLPSVDAPVVPDELLARHLLLNLQCPPGQAWSPFASLWVISAEISAPLS